MIVVFLIALLVESDASHEDAVFLMDQIDETKNTLIIFENVIEETATVLTYKCGISAIDNLFLFLEKKTKVEVFPNNHSQEISFFRKLGKKISFVDASLLYHLTKQEATLLSFDKELIRLSKSL